MLDNILHKERKYIERTCTKYPIMKSRNKGCKHGHACVVWCGKTQRMPKTHKLEGKNKIQTVTKKKKKCNVKYSKENTGSLVIRGKNIQRNKNDTF